MSSRVLLFLALLCYHVHSTNVFPGQKIYFYLNHPIKWVRLVGIIVSFDNFKARWVFILDDSSGATIEVMCPRDTAYIPNELCATTSETAGRLGDPDVARGKSVTGNKIDMGGIELGAVVKVKGGIGTFRGEKQILLERISMPPKFY